MSVSKFVITEMTGLSNQHRRSAYSESDALYIVGFRGFGRKRAAAYYLYSDFTPGVCSAIL